MKNVKAGLIVVLLAWLIPVTSLIFSCIDFIKQENILKSGYKITEAEIILKESENVYESSTINLEYTINDNVFNNEINRYMIDYSPINGGLVKIIYNENNPNEFEIAKQNTIMSNAIMLIIISLLEIYVLKKIYPRAKARALKEYKDWDFVEAEIIDSNLYNKFISIYEKDGKVEVYKSLPFTYEINAVLKSKNICSIRVYKNPKDSKRIVIDSGNFLGGNEDDK